MSSAYDLSNRLEKSNGRNHCFRQFIARRNISEHLGERQFRFRLMQFQL